MFAVRHVGTARLVSLDTLVSTRSTKSNVLSRVEPSGIWAYAASNSIESATQTNRKLRWFDSWVFDVRRRCTSAHFPVNRPPPPAVTGGQGAR